MTGGGRTVVKSSWQSKEAEADFGLLRVAKLG
jgi:hypothetical protein